MKFAQIILVAGISLSGVLPLANAGPARFWISTSLTNPIVPEAPVINAAIGRPITLYIWAQLATDDQGASHTLQDFSLDVVTEQASGAAETTPFIDFIDDTFKVYNDVGGSTAKRFLYVADSSRIEDQGGALTSDRAPSEILDTKMNGYRLPDAIKGLAGTTVHGLAAGIGNTNDTNHVGSAWPVAEFQFESLQASGTNSLFLQIGPAGILSEGIETTKVLLGNDASPEYDGSCTRDTCSFNWEHTLLGDTFDIQINGKPFVQGDYNSDGAIGLPDYSLWKSTFGRTVVPGSGADGNNDGIVDSRDYIFWRKKMASIPPGIGSSIVPEPDTAALTSIFIVLAAFLREVRQRRRIRSI